MEDRRFSLLGAIGNTPLIKIGNVYAKLESVNPSGSIKDRVALEIVETAEREGKLKKGSTIVEASSGNTGISLAMIAAVKGYRMIVVMPENMSEERVQMMRAFGAELVQTTKSGSLKEAIEKAEEMAKSPNTFLAKQFSNPANVKAQEKTGTVGDPGDPVDRGWRPGLVGVWPQKEGECARPRGLCQSVRPLGGLCVGGVLAGGGQRHPLPQPG